jgi:hypothetical protein
MVSLKLLLFLAYLCSFPRCRSHAAAAAAAFFSNVHRCAGAFHRSQLRMKAAAASYSSASASAVIESPPSVKLHNLSHAFAFARRVYTRGAWTKALGHGGPWPPSIDMACSRCMLHHDSFSTT